MNKQSVIGLHKRAKEKYMSSPIVEAILTRAMSDSAFANTLFTNPDAALAGYTLTPAEIASLKAMTPADFAQYQNASPEARKSFGTVGINIDPNHGLP
jgi:hypothetical protein